MSFLFKNFLSFEELADYLESQGYCYNLDNERDYNRLKNLIVDLNRERKLMPVFYYSGWGNVEVVKQKGLEVIDSGEVYFRGYFGVVQMAEILRKLFKNGEPIDIKQYHCYHYSTDDIARLAIHGDDADESRNSTSLTTVEFETDKPSFFITFDDLRYPRTTFDSFFKINQIDERSQQLEEAQNKIIELENKLLKVQEAKPKVAVIPFGKRLDFISKDLPQSERIKKSYELCSDNISFYEDTHPVNTPDEMIKRIQGLLKVIRDKDSKISELEKQTDTPNNAQGKIDGLENQLAQANAALADKPADDNTEQDHLYDWQAMDKNQYPPELHLTIEIWKEYYQADVVEHITQFDSGRFNRISTKLNLSKGNLKDRVRTLLTPLNSKTRSPELLSSLEVINIIHNDKLEQD